MEVTESSPPSRKIYDPIRKKWLSATPEELVRQKVLALLTGKLGYPAHSIAIEKSLSELPHLRKGEIPRRRVDILCYETGRLRPLLLIECKGISLREEMLAQVMGYNAFIRAPLICLASDKELLLEWGSARCAAPLDALPPYTKLRDETRSIPYS